MPLRDLRAEVRIPVNQRGNLSYGQSWFPCVILDMSNHGFQMLCTRQLDVGQVLALRCELFRERSLDCQVQIRHSSDATLGTKITQIDPRGETLYQLYLQQLFAEKAGRPEASEPPRPLPVNLSLKVSMKR